MQPPPEVFRSKSHRVYCDGSGQVDPALGHPRVYYQIDDETGFHYVAFGLKAEASEGKEEKE